MEHHSDLGIGTGRQTLSRSRALPDQEEESAKSWAADVASALADAAHRPRTLLVLLNPWGGSGRAQGVWEREAYPVLSQAGAPLFLVWL